MRTASSPLGLAALATAAVLTGTAPSEAGAAGEASPRGITTLQPAEPCGFFRGQAYGKGLEHHSVEMLWACEAIAERRAAAMPLGDRLTAAEAALQRYQGAVVAAGREAFASGLRPSRLGLSDAAKRSLAESTGALAAMEAIQAGF